MLTLSCFFAQYAPITRGCGVTEDMSKRTKMPIIDGLTSTKMIRSFERTRQETSTSLAARSTTVLSTPIFIVSASLVEERHAEYVDGGFDGWIPKPIDFEHVKLLLNGIVDPGARSRATNTPGEWERGGWFSDRWGPNVNSIVSSLPPPSSSNSSLEHSAR